MLLVVEVARGDAPTPVAISSQNDHSLSRSNGLLSPDDSALLPSLPRDGHQPYGFLIVGNGFKATVNVNRAKADVLEKLTDLSRRI